MYIFLRINFYVIFIKERERERERERESSLIIIIIHYLPILSFNQLIYAMDPLKKKWTLTCQHFCTHFV
jgi:hypothetical protein